MVRSSNYWVSGLTRYWHFIKENVSGIAPFPSAVERVGRHLLVSDRNNHSHWTNCHWISVLFIDRLCSGWE